MSKKIVLTIVLVVVLTTAQNLFAKPKEAPRQEGKKQKDQVKQLRGPQAPHQQAAGTTKNKPMKQQFGKWFGQMEQAYKENDREKMGQLLKSMRQTRKNLKGRKGQVAQARQQSLSKSDTPKAHGQQFRGGHGEQRQFRPCDQPQPRAQMKHWGQGFQPKMQMQGFGQEFPRRDAGQWGQEFPRSGVSRQSQGFQHSQRFGMNEPWARIMHRRNMSQRDQDRPCKAMKNFRCPMQKGDFPW